MRTVGLVLVVMGLAPRPLGGQLVPTLEWEVGAEGESGGGLIFGDAVTAQFLPDGRVVVRDVLNRSLHVLTREGRGVVRMGRRGSGPAEFRTLGPLVVTDSTLIVADGRLPRFVVFDHAGEHQFTGTVPFPGRPATAYWMVAQGRGVMRELDLLVPGEDPTSVENHVSYVTEDGARLDTLFSQYVGAIGGRVDGRLLFVQSYSEPEGDYGLSGDSILAAGQGPSGTIRWWRLDSEGATLVSEFDLGLNRDPIDRDTCDRIVDEYRLSSPERGRQIPMGFEASCPAFWSGILRIVPASGSEAWVLINRSPGVPREERETEWVFVDSKDETALPVTLPGATRVLASHAGRLLTVRRTELDIPVIQVWTVDEAGR